MRKMPLLCLLLWLAAGTAQAQKISNIRSTLEPSCGYYTITFDLEGKADDQYQLKLVPYLGSKEIAEPKFAIGAGLLTPTSAGKGLQVFWNPILERAGAVNWQFRIEAKSSPWIFVEGGSFMMGSSDGDRDEKPVHKVTLSSFLIGKYEVTQKEWTEVMGNNPSHWQKGNLPVEQVNWYDAVDYCNKRSLKEGFQPCYSISGNTSPSSWSQGTIICDWKATGYRLPTEAEWEFAARGGNLSKGYKYSGSNDIGSVAWYKGNSRNRTKPVGNKQPNELGIHDMSGNVWEWCWDWYDSGYYAMSSISDPSGAGSGSSRVLRSGSYYNNDSNCRVSNRTYDLPDYGYYSSGFRLSRTIK